MFSLLRHELRSRRAAILWWSIGLGLYSLLVMLSYLQLAETMKAFNLQDIPLYQAFGDFSDLATFEGFFAAQILTYFPIMASIYGLSTATSTLAGEEDAGTLELILAMPLKRWQIVTAKALAIATSLFLIVSLSSIGVIVGYALVQDQVDTAVEAVDMVRATINVWPISLLFAMIGLFLGAYLPSRRLATTLASVFLAVSYLGNNLAAIIESLETVQPLLPFYYFGGKEVIATGVDVSDLLTLLGAAVVFFALALLSFQRRNITVRAWPWQ
ncbi:MAG: ABC transporter permease subunit [Anaerolineae bacterium]